MTTGFSLLKRQVIEKNLCVHCGSCVGVCSVNALAIRDIIGKCEPYQIGNCIECGLCVQTCPGREVNFMSLAIKRQDLVSHSMLGKFFKIFIGHSNNEEIRHFGASGGMATTILLQLLEEEVVDGVVVLDFSPTKPWFPEVKIVNNYAEIIKAAQSKYFIYPQNLILKTIRESSFNKIAYFGLPCQVHGIKKAIQHGVPGTEKIKYILGCYCGNNLYYEATLSLFKRFKVADLEQVNKIAYREGEYPGNFLVISKNGKRNYVDKFTFNYLSFFYTPFRCLFCIDLTNELADLSFGDGWDGNFIEKNKKGCSVIIVRNSDFLSFFERGQKDGRYIIESISQDAAVKMHSNVLDNKKRGAYARMNLWKWIGEKTPEYFLKSKNISFTRYIFEGVTLFLLSVFSLNFSRYLSALMPLSLIRPFLRNIRGTWRRKTADNNAKLWKY